MKIFDSGTQNHDDAYESFWADVDQASVPDISFVIPVMNEEATLDELTSQIFANVPSGKTFEILFIDDGSSDHSWDVIKALSDLFPKCVRGLRFRANRGKAAALQSGFNAARGTIIFTMDADLQDDAQEIPRFLAKLEEGFDLVSGWKEVRHDPWHKVLPSRVFNRMLSRFSKVNLHDHNCGFKCYRSEVAKSIRLFGELHRMVPSLAGMQGFRVTEIIVKHHPRRFGKSKYGIERFIRGFSDMLTMGFLRVYRERPSHFANSLAAAYCVIAACLVLVGMAAGPLTISSLMCCLVALCFVGVAGVSVMAGLLGELMIRAQHRPSSSVVEDTRHVTNSTSEETSETQTGKKVTPRKVLARA